MRTLSAPSASSRFRKSFARFSTGEGLIPVDGHPKRTTPLERSMIARRRWYFPGWALKSPAALSVHEICQGPMTEKRKTPSWPHANSGPANDAGKGVQAHQRGQSGAVENIYLSRASSIALNIPVIDGTSSEASMHTR
jgi:hypothetical protein